MFLHASGRRYRTTVNAAEAPIRRLWIGLTIPTGSQVHSVTLDGRQVGWNACATNRGVEVTTPVEPGEHTLLGGSGMKARAL